MPYNFEPLKVCAGTTKSGAPCKRRGQAPERLADYYCPDHIDQKPPAAPNPAKRI